MNRMKKILLVVVGSLSFIAGAIGVFVPLLPTTPFWLLTCWCYIRSSRRLYDRVMNNKYVGTYIRDYVEDKAIPLTAKVRILSVMWLSTLLTTLFLVDYWWVRLCLVLISTGVTWHIVSFPTKKKEPIKNHVQ